MRRGERPVLLAGLHRHVTETGAPVGAGAPFTDRLVVKFGLPVTGWRGRQARLPGPAADGRTVASEGAASRGGPAAGPGGQEADGEEVTRADA